MQCRFKTPPLKKSGLSLIIPLIMTTQAQSFEFYQHGIEGSLDSQLSMGSSWRLEQPDDTLLTQGTRNENDGDANYKKGDAFSQVFKGSHDLQISYQNFGGFLRGKYWYDSALENNSVEYGHTANGSLNGSNPNEKLNDSNFNDLSKFSGAQILDAFIYGEFEIADMPIDVRLGKQVVSWGESTFIFGGINSINPVDISAFQRPGAEIKEGLIPVNMLYTSIGLNDNLSAEAFYQLEFQETVLPGCGTYLSSNDYAPEGCDGVFTSAGIIARSEDLKAKNSDQFGLAFRYIAESLDTEFGFYAMNIHSRTPQVNGIKASLSNSDYQQIQADAIALYTAVLSSGGTIPGFDNPTDFVIANIGVANANSARYYISYPEDIQLYGLSFATNAGSLALSGEVSHKKDNPIQINSTQLIITLLGGQSSSQELTDIYQATAPGEEILGYQNFDITQLQVTAIKLIDQVMGASQITLVGEAGYTHVHELDESRNAIKFGRSDIFEPTATQAFDNDGYVTQSAWGYRARIMASYMDVFSGINLTPQLAWSHDVKGYAPQAGGAFSEGQQSLGVTLNADYLAIYNASIGYTQYMGGDYSLISDRDFASISVGMQF